MPTYEYECTVCGYKFEMFQKISDEPIVVCPKCNGKVKRLISTNGSFILKGNGWYVTDYAKNNKNQVHESNKPANQTTEKSSVSNK
jgi:putative FmdB family regulatory protein